MNSLSIPDPALWGESELSNGERMAALHGSGLLDTPPEEAFDRLTRLAARLINAPVAIISLVDDQRQFFKSQVGLREPWYSMRETPLTHSFCKYVVESGKSMIVTDARTHPLVRDNLAVHEMNVLAYAGVPLRGAEGHVLGSFAVIDHLPREWSADEMETLTDLAASASTEIGLRTALRVVEDARAEVQRKEQRLQHALEAGRLGAWEVDLSTEEMTCTDQCKANFGREADVGFSYEEMFGAIHPEDREEAAKRVREAIEQRKEYEAEYRVVWPEGEVHHIAARGTVSYAADGRALRITGTTQDISEEVRIRRDLEQVSRAKSEFLAVISHELRTPLTGIMAYSDLLRLGIPEPIPPAAQHQVERIDAAARHLLVLIEEILTFSRIEAGKEDVRSESFSLADVLGDAVAFVRPVAEKKGLALCVSTPPELALESDEGKVRQVITNLLSNAVKFTDRGEIRVTSELAGDTLRISVQDTGIGIAPENLRKIFEPFWQVAQPNTRTVGGTGLGLSVSRRIAQLVGGDLEAASTVGQGSTFAFTIPVQRPVL